MRLFHHYKTSLSARLLVQMLVVSVVVCAVLGVLAVRVVGERVESEIARRSGSVMHSLEVAVGISSAAQLGAAVKDMGDRGDVESMFVAAGSPPVILASTRAEWLRREVSAALPGTPVPDGVRQAVLSRRTTPGYARGRVFENIVPVMVATKAGRVPGAAYLALDAAHIRSVMYANAFEAVAWLGGGLFVLLLSFYLSFHRAISRPLRSIETAIRRQSQGDQGARAEILHADEIGHVAKSLNEMVDQLAKTQGQLVRYTQDMEIKAIELAAAKADAERVTRLKSDFLAMMSHEIRTPMNGVMGMTELLLESGLNPRQEKYAKTVMFAADTLLSILNDVLDLSKIEAGKLELESGLFDLQAQIESLCALFSRKVEERGNRLTVEWEKGMPVHFVGDGGRIGQIVSNLLSNAIKFTRDGEIRLRLSAAPREDGMFMLEVRVSDSGIGIPADILPKIFEKFTQADTSTTRRFGGTGLGLAICRQLATAMGGDVGVESSPGAGSAFWLAVPLRRASAAEIADARIAAPAEAPDAQALRGTRVLLVEDNQINQDFAIEMLKTMGCAVTLAKTGSEAVGLYDPGGFDVVLMDCEMPEMDGYEATRRLRDIEKKKEAPRVPVIALTANVLKGAREKCLDAGMDTHLSKPVSRKDLRAALMHWLRRNDAPPPEQPAAPPESGGDALQEIRELMGEQYPSILRTFLTNTDNLLARLGGSLKPEENAPEFVREVHSLKSSSRYMGAPRLGAAAERLEHAARSFSAGTAELRDVHILLEELRKSWQSARGFYESELKKNTA